MSSGRPRRNCRNRGASLSQPTPQLANAIIVTSSLQPTSLPVAPPTSSVVIIQPSPKAHVRSRSRIHSLNSNSQSSLTPLDRRIRNENVNCPICALHVQDSENGLMCDKCTTWFHAECLYVSESEYTALGQSNDGWLCDHCKAANANRIKWGRCEGEDNILLQVRAAYQEIISWKKNIFLLPRGKAASDFIKEMTRLINLFVFKTKWEWLALPLLHIFMPIMLQKPSRKSKAKDHSRFLSSRLQKWNEGDLRSLLAECREIQKRLAGSLRHKQESNRKAFSRHMLAGKVKKAMSFINNSNDVKGVHCISEEIRNILQAKHPRAEHPDVEVLLKVTEPPAQNVMFENITADLIKQSSKQLNGSGGPTLIDADGWKHIICSRSYGNDSTNLAEAIAGLAKRLSTEHVHPDCLQEFLSCRLIPLDKGSDSHGNPGVRPIGIGEVLRRIIGKSVVHLLKSDIQEAAGCLQMCTGIRSGIEAAVHMVEKTWNEDATEAILLVDADNAFNRLNRQVALHNVKQTCPPMYQYLHNHYQVPANLILCSTSMDDPHLSSEEGCTQGDPSAMHFYALGIKPLVDKLDTCLNPETGKQSWYADDSNAIGKLIAIKTWWEELNHHGPKYGYFPKPQKTVLLLKNQSLLTRAKALFADFGVQIKIDGHRYLGSAIGTPSFKNTYIQEKVKSWVEDVKELAKYAEEDPQICLSAYSKGLCHRWSFIQRTLSGISSFFEPLEQSIRDVLIPAIVGRQISDIERRVISLPVRHGGLGIPNPVLTCDREYEASKKITHGLVELIYHQEKDISLFDSQEQDQIIKDLKANKENHLKTALNDTLACLEDQNMKRSLKFSTEKGCGTWLTVLPLQKYGYCLNKNEFRDAICLRYGWNIPKMPHFCGCGQKNSVDHTMICKKGGYVAMRHNNLRDINAEMQREVCRDVVVEPQLLPLTNEEVEGVQGDRAAPDISSRGMWSTFERTFYDVRVLHPNAPSYQQTDLNQLYRTHELEKMRKYNARVMTVERGSFTPLIYTTYGGWGPQATRYHKRMAEKIATRKNEKYCDVLSHMRARIRFSLLRSTLVAVRGERGKRRTSKPFGETSFNLIPGAQAYESF